MARILFLVRHFDRGGAQRQLIALARAIRERGETVAVAVFYPGGPLYKEALEAGVSVVSLDKYSRWQIAGFLRRLVLLIRQFRPGRFAQLPWLFQYSGSIFETFV